MDQPDHRDELILQAWTDGELTQCESGILESLEDPKGLIETEHESEWDRAVRLVASIVRGHGGQRRQAR